MNLTTDKQNKIDVRHPNQSLTRLKQKRKEVAPRYPQATH